MTKAIHRIIKNHTPVYFVSPHLDDALLSAGGLISYLSDKVPVTVINVFTRSHSGLQTLSQMAFLHQSGYTDPLALQRARQKEDKRAFSFYPSLKVINLGFTDALWRQKTPSLISPLARAIPELSHIYPTYRWHISRGQVSDLDREIIPQVRAKLTNIIGTSPNSSLVFCPFAVGQHVDHVIVRDLCALTFPTVYYWEDFPYISKFSADPKFIQLLNLKKALEFSKNQTPKIKSLSQYTSQIKAIFKDNLPKIPNLETYYHSPATKQLSVIITVPAYNEAANIANFIQDILNQSPSPHHKLEKILVYSDGSTDDTNQIVGNFPDPRVELISSSKRLGRTHANNALLSQSDSDVTLLMDADIRIIDPLFLSRITLPFVSSTADLVSCPIHHLPATNWLEKSLAVGMASKNRVFESYNSGDNALSCHGPVRAMSRRLVKAIHFPDSSGEDKFTYIFAKSQGFRYAFVPDTNIYYRLPKSLSDHWRQSWRYFNSGRKIPKNSFNPPWHLYFLSGFWEFIQSPVYSALYLILVSFTFLRSRLFPQKNVNSRWDMVVSSKSLAK